MKLLFALLALVSATCQADMYRCPSTSGTVYQETPCGKGGTKIVIDTPAPQATSSAASDKLAKDKAYIDERVNARIYDREKSESMSRVQACDFEAAELLARADSVQRGMITGQPATMADAIAIQADNQRRQTEVISLQGRAAAKRDQCSAMRRDHEQRFKK